MKDLFDEFHKIRLTMVKVVINELFVYSKIFIEIYCSELLILATNNNFSLI